MLRQVSDCHLHTWTGAGELVAMMAGEARSHHLALASRREPRNLGTTAGGGVANVDGKRDAVTIEFSWIPETDLTVIRDATTTSESLLAWRRGELTAEALVGNPGGRVEVVSVKRVRDGELLYSNVSRWLDSSAR